jgi:hypothetical protein
MPKMCAELWKLKPLGPKTWKTWWPYAKAALDELWKQHPALYQECINRNSVAVEVKNASESVRRNYAKRHIKQAFVSVAKNLGKGFLA